MVKEELNSEEKFFEKAVITEKFIKKYKFKMIASVVVIITLIGANLAYDLNKQRKVTSANEALEALHIDAKNAEALLALKSSSPNLYDVWIYSQAIAKGDFITLKEVKKSSAFMIKDLTSYELAQNNKDIKSLARYSKKEDAVYRDLALVQSAIILMGDSKIDEAHKILQKVPLQSSFSQIASALLHYGVK